MKSFALTIFVGVIFARANCKYEIDSVPLNDVEFTEFPYIKKDSVSYYLHYQLRYCPTMKRLLLSKLYKGKACYYFSKRTSHKEFGEPMVRDLRLDNYIEYAEKDEVYLMDGDTSIVKLNIFK